MIEEGWLYTAIASILVVGTTVYFLYPYYLGYRSREWELVRAKVLKNGWDDGLIHRATLYFPVVRYTYTYKGVKYYGDKYSFVREYRNSKKDAWELAKKYAESSKIDVYVNKNNPRLSVINSGVTFWQLSRVVVVFVVMLIFILSEVLETLFT